LSQTLQLTNDELLKAMCLVAGINRNPAGLDATTENDFRAMIRAGLRKFFSPPPIDGGIHQWRFLDRQFFAAYQAPYDTGTVTISGGTVTLDSGTWPTWAADGLLRVDGHSLFVTARTSDTVITISNTGLAEAAGTEYTLYRWRYPMPSDFGELIGRVVYAHPNCGRMLRGVMDTEIRLRYAANFQTGSTRMYAVVPGGDSTADDDDWYFTFWPTFDADASGSAPYRAVPSDNLDSDDLLVGPAVIQADAVHAQTMLAAILCAVEEYYNTDYGWGERFMERLKTSIAHDRHTAGPVDFSGQPGVDQRRLSLLFHEPTYNDLLA
jgi:hypothetical protein